MFKVNTNLVKGTALSLSAIFLAGCGNDAQEPDWNPVCEFGTDGSQPIQRTVHFSVVDGGTSLSFTEGDVQSKKLLNQYIASATNCEQADVQVIADDFCERGGVPIRASCFDSELYHLKYL